MKYFICILLAYLIGSLSPSALIARIKHKDLKEEGTGNLGATNTTLVFGKKLGFLVMIFDIFKAFLAVKISVFVAPEVEWFAILVGFFAIIGHCFPFYLRFKGGKGLAAFAGLVLAYDPLLFFFLLISGTALMLIVNYSFILPFYASVFFTVYIAIREDSIVNILLSAIASTLIMIMHFSNFVKAAKGQEQKIREYVKNKLFHQSNAE